MHPDETTDQADAPNPWDDWQDLGGEGRAES
jgi:hypothetical protein